MVTLRLQSPNNVTFEETRRGPPPTEETGPSIDQRLPTLLLGGINIHTRRMFVLNLLNINMPDYLMA